MASYLWLRSAEEPELEIYGTITDTTNGSFTLVTRDGREHVLLSAQSELEDGRTLSELRLQGVIVEVEGIRQPDGSIMAAKVEVEGQEYSD